MMLDFERDEDFSLGRFVLYDLLKFVKCPYRCLMTTIYGIPSKILILRVPSCSLVIRQLLHVPPCFRNVNTRI